MSTANPERRPTRPTAIDRLYFVGVAVKGFDGLVETVVGLILAFVPTLPHVVLEAVAGRAVRVPAPVGPGIAGYLEGLDGDLARSGSTILIAYLIAHGLIKIALVYCLLRRLYRVYPLALAVLAVFLAYQIYLLVTGPTVLLAVFTALDAVIIYLVYQEYRELKSLPQQ